MIKRKRYYYIIMRKSNPDLIIQSRKFCQYCFPPAEKTKGYIIEKTKWRYKCNCGNSTNPPECTCKEAEMPNPKTCECKKEKL
jgi:hypothetical protein